MAHFCSNEALVLTLCDTDFQALRAHSGRIAKVVDPIERVRKLGLVKEGT